MASPAGGLEKDPIARPFPAPRGRDMEMNPETVLHIESLKILYLKANCKAAGPGEGRTFRT